MPISADLCQCTVPPVMHHMACQIEQNVLNSQWHWTPLVSLQYSSSYPFTADRAGLLGTSIAEALSWYFSILVNKICKIMKIFG